VVNGLKLNDPLLASEVFGPILAILTYPTGRLASIPDTVGQTDRTPLGLYLFSEGMAKTEYIRARTWSDGMCTMT